jgi:hypothetical protein
VTSRSNPIVSALRSLAKLVKGSDSDSDSDSERRDLALVFEICFPMLKVAPKHVFGQSVHSDSAGTFSSKQYGATPSGQAIYRSWAKLKDLQYLLVTSPKDESADRKYFVFKRKFKTYGPQWSAWEDCDSATSNSNFFWLATRDSDRSGEASRVAVPEAERPKVRFRIQTFDDYLATVRRDTDPTLDEVDDVI